MFADRSHYFAGMTNEASDSSAPTGTPVTAQDFFKAPTDLLWAVSVPARWAILRELAAGESRSVLELAAVAGRSADLISKHLKSLREAGAVELVAVAESDGRKQYYAVPSQYRRQEAGKPVLDYGVCVLRFS